MATRPRLVFLLLFVLFFVVAMYTVGIQPDNVLVTEGFPVGLLAGSLLLARRRWWPLLTLGAAAVSTAVYLLNDRDPVVAVGWGVAASLGAWVAVETMTLRATQRAALITEIDLRHFVGAGALGAGVAAVLTSVVAMAIGYAPWWVVMPGVGLAHFVTYLVLMPHFMGRPRFPGLAHRAERVAQWTLTITCTVVVFLPLNDWPSLAFCIIPFIGWGAMRLPMRETLVQLLCVVVLSHAMTMQGMGPFSTVGESDAIRADLLTATYALFLCALALVTIPFALAVGIQRRQSWQARQEQARIQQLVQSAAGVAIIGTDSLGSIDLFNPGAEAMLGYTAKEVHGRMPSLFFTEAEIERLARRLGCPATFIDVAVRLAAGDVESLDVEFVRKDGQRLTLQFSMSQVHDSDGRVIGYVSTGEDVTDRVNRQRALEEALAAERVAVENLKEVDQVKDALVSGVSHELRTPITSILGYLEMLEDGGFGDLTPQQAKALGRVKGNSNRLLTLIDDLLMLSRIQDGYLDLERSSIDLREVVTRAYEEMAPALLAAGIDFRHRVPTEPVPVTGDPERLGRVLVNLLGNASKFTDRFGTVALELDVADEVAVVVVRDTGIGIPLSEQPHLFDRFFRAAAARERAIQGSGLGLSIARALVQSHGGRIDVESQVGQGSEFRVRLPLEGAVTVPEQDRARARAATNGRHLPREASYQDSTGTPLPP